ncbi:MAG: hypothetical protein ACRDD1_01865 [Planctomycetia bacterium]
MRTVWLATAVGTAAALSAGAVPVHAQGGFDLAVNAGLPADKEPLYPLTPDVGPVMVRAGTFIGPSALTHANMLCKELREKHRIAAYTMNHQIEERSLSKEELDEFEQRFGVRLRRPKLRTTPPENWVVMAGSFAEFDDKNADRLLKTIQELTPTSLPAEVTASMRLGKGKNGKPLPPLGNASLVQNPLSKKKMVAQADRELLKMLLKLNSDDKYSAYQITSPLTIEVAEFRGLSTVDMSEEGKKKADSLFNVKSSKKTNGLQIAGKNATILCEELRRLGHEAYVFHGQFASIVMIGGYDDSRDPKMHEQVKDLSTVKAAGVKLTPKIRLTPVRPQL